MLGTQYEPVRTRFFWC